MESARHKPTLALSFHLRSAVFDSLPTVSVFCLLNSSASESWGQSSPFRRRANHDTGTQGQPAGIGCGADFPPRQAGPIHTKPGQKRDNRSRFGIAQRQRRWDVHLQKYELGKDEKILPNFKGKNRKPLTVNLHYPVENKSNVEVTPRKGAQISAVSLIPGHTDVRARPGLCVYGRAAGRT